MTAITDDVALLSHHVKKSYKASSCVSATEPQQPPLSVALVALVRLVAAGFRVDMDASGRLAVSPAKRLTAAQRDWIQQHKPALVALLLDADTVYSALVQAGTAGLAWRESTPDWPDARLLAADEVLYGDGRMVNRNDRRYLREHGMVKPALVEHSLKAGA